MESLPLYELHKICRICLKNDILVSIYSPTFLITPVEMIEKLQMFKGNYQLPIDENLPTLLCQSCLYRLLDAYNLQQLAEASEQRLRDYLGLNSIGSTVCSNLNDCNDNKIDLNVEPIYDLRDMFPRNEIASNELIEVGGNDDVDLLNDVEIDVSSLTRSEADDNTLSDVFVSKNTHNNMLSCRKIPNIETIQNNAIICRDVEIKESHGIINSTGKVKKNKSAKKPDQCLECGKIFHYRGYLEIHKRVHSGEKPYKCQHCARQFSQSNKLHLHQRVHGQTATLSRYCDDAIIAPNENNTSSYRRYQCEICAAFFTTSSNLKAHRHTHCEQRNFKCKQCQRAFKSQRELRRHEPIHKTVKDIICSICQRAFNKGSYLNAHMITVHRGIRRHKCNECDKVFGKRSNLISHMRTHTGEKPYQCALCPWKFNQSSALTRHLKKHTKSKPSESSQRTQEEEEVNYRHLTNIFMYDFSKETNPISDYTQRLQLPQPQSQNEINLLPHNIY
uniref:Protein krueppel n=1 Tax=Glossina austeni TaxID=7395 RepID=A0A1A9UGV7_GLOAU